jgi:hypothetical protein
VPVHLEIQEESGDFEALLDTGFDGYLAIPAGALAALEAPDGHEMWHLADGSEVLTPWYQRHLGSRTASHHRAVNNKADELAGEDARRVLLDWAAVSRYHQGEDTFSELAEQAAAGLGLGRDGPTP